MQETAETDNQTTVLSASELPLPGRPLALEERELHLPGYRLLTVLGSGGMGTVFLALQESLQRHVAIKMLRANLSRATTAAVNLQEEAQTMASFSHPNVLSCYDIVSYDEHLFLIMEYIPGRMTVRSLLTRYGTLPERVILKIMLGITRGLSYIFQKGILHRDLKPDNLMIFLEEELSLDLAHLSCDELFQQQSTRVVICDFGIAHRITSIMQTDPVIGSPMYMAPEQFDAGKKQDCRTDLYALGSVSYFLLTGQPPFPNIKRQDLADHKVRHNLPDPRELNDKTSPELARIVQKLGRAHPEQRYQNHAELIADIESLLSRNDEWFSLAKRHISHRSLWRGVALGAVIALAGHGAWKAYQYAQALWFRTASFSLTQSLGYWKQPDQTSWTLVKDPENEDAPLLRSSPNCLPIVLHQPLATGMTLEFSIRFQGNGATRFGLQNNAGQAILHIQWSRLNNDYETFLQMSSNGQQQLINIGSIVQQSQDDWLHMKLELQKQRVTISANGEKIGIALLKAPISCSRFYVRSWRCPVIEIKDVYRIVSYGKWQ